ncbi:MAG: SIR2 family NAD-dependent protein deacylase [Oscillospiraceae bacterium]|jgi:NAD-dependent SIR2 family protein deacetylase
MTRYGIVYETTGIYQSELQKLSQAFETADAVIVGAGSGLSTSAGFDYSGERLRKYFGDFVEKYGMTDMYSGCFADFETREERWAYWSRWAWIHRYCPLPKDTLNVLLGLLSTKDFFVITTNIDHTFQRAGFPKDRLFYTQGDFGLFQCSRPCHAETYDNYEILKAMREQEKDMKVPVELIPHCPKCGAEMDFNLYWDDTFVRDSGWHAANDRYQKYLQDHSHGRILYLELGVGFNSPGVIKVPFWQMAVQNRDSLYASVNLNDPCFPEILRGRSIVISHDIDETIRDLKACHEK